MKNWADLNYSAEFNAKAPLSDVSLRRKVIHRTLELSPAFIPNDRLYRERESIHYKTKRNVISLVAVIVCVFFQVDIFASNDSKTIYGTTPSTQIQQDILRVSPTKSLYVNLTNSCKGCAKVVNAQGSGIAPKRGQKCPINFATVPDFERLADAIKRAENSRTKPYGILKPYCSAKTEAQCRKGCLQTIQKAYSRYKKGPQSLDFISFLAKTYAPVGASNDPKNLNKNWIKNVTYFYTKEAL